jgi:hypothetical protein
MNLALIARAGIEPDIAGVAFAAIVEPKIVIVLSRIDLDAIGEAFEDKLKHRPHIRQRQRGGSRHVLDKGFVGV